MTELKQALINQGNSPAQADDLIEEMREQVGDGYDPADVLLDNGLEPDYIEDLLS
jgi:hypothetical protein